MILGTKTGLRAIERNDLQQLRDWRNLEHFRKNFRESKELNLDNQEQWFSAVSNRSTDYMFGIVDLETQELIGAAGLLYINWIIRAADFSFYIGRNEEYIDEKGFALDAANTLINFGFNTLNLNKIWMELYEFDQMKLDFFINEFQFNIDGKLRHNCFEDGKYWDSYILSLLRSEYVNK